MLMASPAIANKGILDVARVFHGSPPVKLCRRAPAGCRLTYVELGYAVLLWLTSARDKFCPGKYDAVFRRARRPVLNSSCRAVEASATCTRLAASALVLEMLPDPAGVSIS